jgi:hypothetical protein
VTLAPTIRRVSPPRKRGSRKAPRAPDAAFLRQASAPHDLDPRVCGDDSHGERASAEVFSETIHRASSRGTRRALIIACGALAREVLALNLGHIDVACLPAQLHNYPKQIPGAMRAKIRANRESYDEILCLYGDCGTGGELDRVLAEEGVSRVEGAHCYAFYAGEQAFSALAEEEPGTFYLTDFLVRHFDALVIRGLALDRFPELRDDYFGNYRRVVHLAQFEDADLETKAKAAADRLGLAYERRFTGLDGIRRFLDRATQKKDASWPI